MEAKYARVNWKSLGEVKAEKPSHWTWNAPTRRSKVRFIPNPTTTPEKLVRVKLSKGRKAKLFRAPAVKPTVVRSDRNTAKASDKNSCTVNAFAVAANIPFFMAQAALRGAGRRESGGFSLQPGVNKNYTGKVAGFKLTRVTRGCQRLAWFLQNHPVGRFYVEGRRHAFAVVNGVVMNDASKTRPNSTSVVEAAYKISADNRE